MKDEIKKIIENAKKLKLYGSADIDIAKFIHIELGKLIVYDNNYSIRTVGFDIDNNIEGTISEESVNRQRQILDSETNVDNKEQVCKGMAEICSAIYNSIGIESSVVGVKEKQDVEGEEKDGKIIHVPEKYKCKFNNNGTIENINKEIRENDEPKHWYCVVHTEAGEYIQDFLTEKALARIKIGETTINDEQLAGLHLKEEHKERTSKSNITFNQSFRKKVLNEYETFCENNNDSNRAFDFIFSKLQEYNYNFGFEESIDFIDLMGRNLPQGEITQKPNNINLVKEDEKSCQVMCIYQYNKKNYLVRSGISNKNVPIGRVNNEIIEKTLENGFCPRKLSDAKKIKAMRENKKTISMQSVVSNAIAKGITTEQVVDSNLNEQKNIRTTIEDEELDDRN